MADAIGKPDFHRAISDPYYFSGRKSLISEIQQESNKVWILLGGSRIGKTSLLNALEWNFLAADSQPSGRVLPVLIDLNQVQPETLAHLRYLIVARLRKSISRWQQVPNFSFQTPIRELYQSYLKNVSDTQVTINFLKQVGLKLELRNPHENRRLSDEVFSESLLQSLGELRDLGFSNICCLFDNAEFIAKQDWATDAWNYFRSFQESKDNHVSSYVGLVFSGYRELKDYQQKVGSPLLNISNIRWLAPLSESDVRNIISLREECAPLQLNEEDILSIIEWTGCHPCLIHSMLDALLAVSRTENTDYLTLVIEGLLDQQSDVFSSWWNEKDALGRLENEDRLIYKAMMSCREGGPKHIAKLSKKGAGKVKKTLQILCATGLILEVGDGTYKIGSRLFEEWVVQNYKEEESTS
ncbi:MAG: hypothetical protein AAFV85_27035 [Cyanobacteria bacterium J06634_6]